MRGRLQDFPKIRRSRLPIFPSSRWPFTGSGKHFLRSPSSDGVGFVLTPRQPRLHLKACIHWDASLSVLTRLTPSGHSEPCLGVCNKGTHGVFPGSAGRRAAVTGERTLRCFQCWTVTLFPETSRERWFMKTRLCPRDPGAPSARPSFFSSHIAHVGDTITVALRLAFQCAHLA